jgi:sucrose-6F-phosphate phosphohydrolase
VNQRLLLCTDLDRTLIPNGPQPESLKAREKFQIVSQHPQVTLVYVTGRHLALIQDAIERYNLPVPDYIIGDVGSTIYQRNSDHWTIWQSWEDEISPDWSGMSHTDIERLLRHINELQLQEQSKQNRHKLSYYFPLNTDIADLLKKVAAVVDRHGIKASLINSIDEPASIGLLDILPARANKKHAIEFAMEQLGFTFEQTIFAGDSGNDLPVLVSPINAILVANAHEDVCTQARQQAFLLGTAKNLYCARGGYLDMNGNYSAGIIEGVIHYMPLVEKWLK